MMKKIVTITIGLLFAVLLSFTVENLPKTFTDLLDQGNMTFENPIGLDAIKIIENDQMNYDYAVKYPTKNFEVRYAIRPLKTLLKDYKDKGTGGNVHPNNLYSTLFQTTALNISGGQFPEINIYDKDAVKEEFNADWGASAFVQTVKEFGQNYKYCMIVGIHKDNFADAYIFYLSDNTEDFEKLAGPVFHALKFK